MPNLHPILVHFTIALFTLSVLFDIAGWILRNDALKAAGWWNLVVAAILSVGTVVTGLLAASSLPHTDGIHELMEMHKLLGIIVLAVILVLFSWRLIRNGVISNRMLPLYVIIGLAGVGTMFAGGYYGGELVYKHGMGVAPMMEQMRKEHDEGGRGSGSGAGHSHGGRVDSSAVEKETGGRGDDTHGEGGHEH